MSYFTLMSLIRCGPGSPRGCRGHRSRLDRGLHRVELDFAILGHCGNSTVRQLASPTSTNSTGVAPLSSEANTSRVIGIEAEGRAMGLVAAKTNNFGHLGIAVRYLLNHSVDAFQVNWAASGGVDEGGSSIEECLYVHSLLTGASVVVIFFLLIWSLLNNRTPRGFFSMTLGSLTSLRANDVARHGCPRARTDAHAPVGDSRCCAIPVMAPLSAACELTDNLSSELSRRQRISMGKSPPCLLRASRSS